MNTLNIESLESRLHVTNSLSFSQARALITVLFAVLQRTWPENEQEDNEISWTEERERKGMKKKPNLGVGSMGYIDKGRSLLLLILPTSTRVTLSS